MKILIDEVNESQNIFMKGSVKNEKYRWNDLYLKKELQGMFVNEEMLHRNLEKI